MMMTITAACGVPILEPTPVDGPARALRTVCHPAADPTGIVATGAGGSRHPTAREHDDVDPAHLAGLIRQHLVDCGCNVRIAVWNRGRLETDKTFTRRWLDDACQAISAR